MHTFALDFKKHNTKSFNNNYFMKSATAFITVHPGDVLRDELEMRGIKQKDFATTIGMPASVLNDIVQGKRSVTPDIAILLEAALGKNASSWLTLQAERDLEVARQKEEFVQKQKDIETWQLIQDCCNVKYLEKYLPNGLGKTIHEKISTILEFFKVKSIEALRDAFVKDVNPAYFRKADKFENNPVNIFTWKHMAYDKSATLSRPKKFDREAVYALIEGLNKILYENKNTIARIESLMNEYGIRFFLFPNQKGTHIDGFSFWKGANPSVALTLRHQKIDILAFTLMHELCHVFRHLNPQNKINTCITLIDVKDSIEEKEADTFARMSLIPAKEWQMFKERNARINPYAMPNRIREFAHKHQIHPAIVLGRYQHDFNIYDNGRGFDRSIN